MPRATQRRSTTPNATFGSHLARFARPDCATEPVRIVPSKPVLSDPGRCDFLELLHAAPNLSELCQATRPLRAVPSTASRSAAIRFGEKLTGRLGPLNLGLLSTRVEGYWTPPR